jgi:hypothetical protein
MGLSGLNAQRFTYNLIDSPLCALCNSGNETPIHYFWDCRSHALARLKLLDGVRGETGKQLTRDNIIDTLVHGKIDKINHFTIYKATISFISDTGRFR